MHALVEVKTQDQSRRPWNRGRLVGPKPPLKLKEIWAIRIRLQVAQRLRDLALFNLALDSKLRGCDLVRLRVADVTLAGRVRSRAAVVQHMCGRPVGSKKNCRAGCSASSGADRCSASDAARSMPRARMGDAMGRAAGSRHHRRSAKRRSAPCPSSTTRADPTRPSSKTAP
jgi:hypothetical protein